MKGSQQEVRWRIKQSIGQVCAKEETEMPLIPEDTPSLTQPWPPTRPVGRDLLSCQSSVLSSVD